jgi:hypothetical protein
MTRPMIREHNVTTDEVIDREMTDIEFAAWEEQQAQIKAADDLQAQELAKAAADKAALLAKLGITADEARLLLS